MDSFSVFSTSPSANKNGATSSATGAAIVGRIPSLSAQTSLASAGAGGVGGAGPLDGAGSRAPAINATLSSNTPPQQQQPGRVGEEKPPFPSSAATMLASPMVFSTSATAMPNHNTSLNPDHLGTQFGTFHLSATLETPADRFDDQALASITQALATLQSISEGKRPAQSSELLDAAQPVETARELSAALSQVASANRSDAIQSIAKGITTPQHLHIVRALEEPYRNEVRDVVLQNLLGQLTRTGSEPMPVYAEMLATLARLKLVRLSGVAVAIEQFLSQPDKRRAGLAVLGRMAEDQENKEPFLRAIQATKKVEPLLCELLKDPQYEYDVLAITRMLGTPGAPSASAVGSVSSAGDGVRGINAFSARRATLEQHAVINAERRAPVTVLQYLRLRDELVSGHADGTVVVWAGPSAATAEVAPLLVMELPNDCIPAVMAAPPQEHYVAVAGVPCPTSGSPYRPFLKARQGNKSRMPAPASGAHSVIRALVYDDEARHWVVGETVVFPANTTPTAMAALPEGVLFVAESSYGANPGSNVAVGVRGAAHASAKRGPMQHFIRTYSARGTSLPFYIPNAHSDVITAMLMFEDSGRKVVSAGRDGSIKVWDTQPPMPAIGQRIATRRFAIRVTPIFTFDTKSAHLDTITTLSRFHNYLFSGSLDGALCVWDTKRVASPIAARTFLSGVLGVAAMEGGRVAVATARGLHLITLDTMAAVDVLPNAVFTQLASNNRGNVLFAASAEGVSVFSLKN